MVSSLRFSALIHLGFALTGNGLYLSAGRVYLVFRAQSRPRSYRNDRLEKKRESDRDMEVTIPNEFVRERQCLIDIYFFLLVSCPAPLFALAVASSLLLLFIPLSASSDRRDMLRRVSSARESEHSYLSHRSALVCSPCRRQCCVKRIRYLLSVSLSLFYSISPTDLITIDERCFLRLTSSFSILCPSSKPSG